MDVPGFEVKLHKLLEHEWEQFRTALNDFCANHNAAHLRDTGKVQQVTENAEAHLGSRVHKVRKKLQNGAQDVHPRFRAEIQRRMTPAFEQAYSIKGKLLSPCEDFSLF